MRHAKCNGSELLRVAVRLAAHTGLASPAALVSFVANVLANVLAGNLNASLRCILQSLTFASFELAWPQFAPAKVLGSIQSPAVTFASWDFGPLHAKMRPRLLEEHERQCRTGTVKGSMFEVRSAMLQAPTQLPTPARIPALLGMVKVRCHDRTRCASWPHPACWCSDLVVHWKAVWTAAERAREPARITTCAPHVAVTCCARALETPLEKLKLLSQKLLGARRCSTWRVTEV